MPDGRDPVRHDDHAPPLRDELAHARADDGLVLRVEGGGGLIEQDDRGVLEQGAGEGHPLPLPAGQGDAALAGAGPPAVGVALDDLVEPGGGRRPPQLRVGGLRGGDAKVVLNGAVQQVGVLEGDGQRAHELRRRDLAQVGAPDPDGAGVDVPEPGDEPEQRGLAGPGRPDDGGQAALGDGDGEVVKDAGLLVAEADALQRDTVPGGGASRRRRLGQGPGLQDGAHPLQGHVGGLDRA